MYHLINDNKVYILSNKEIKLKKDDMVISRTDIEGNILYYNHSFSNITGYNSKELLNMPHSILRHPSMPKAVFFIIWKTLLAGRNTHAIVKNMTKDGDYYWLLMKFIVQKDNENNIISFLSEGKQAPQYAIESVEPLYRDLLQKERELDMESSVRYFTSFLNSNNYATYNDYILDISKKRKKGFFFNLKF